jgi:hypothetical protein
MVIYGGDIQLGFDLLAIEILQIVLAMLQESGEQVQ